MSRASVVKQRHFPMWCEAGDGIWEPRENWLDCTCGVTVWQWMQGYGSSLDGNPEGEFSRHVQGYYERHKPLLHKGRKP